jgi:hypothetical protein
LKETLCSVVMFKLAIVIECKGLYG